LKTHARRVARAAVLGFAMLSLVPASAGAQDPAGKIKFAKPAQADLENTGIAQNSAFISSRYWRVRAYPPSWDGYLSWFPGAWGYKDAYALYNPAAYPPGHVSAPNMNWVLKDAQGRPLYIPFGCDGTECPQYAADLGNPDFRRWWIDGAKQYIQSGYKGVFVDDMTLYPRVSDAASNQIRPIDPRTGQPMTDSAWARYAVEFLEQLRAEIKAIRPDAEVVSNVLWYTPALGGAQDEYVKRLIAANDYLEIERGYTDTHPQSNPYYSWETCLRWVDYAHSQGKGIVADSYASTRAGAEYELATSLLVNEGRDSLSTGYRALPTNWWPGYETDLGAAKGRRYAWNGGWRRDFERGTVIVAPPGTTVSGAVGDGLKDLDGTTRTSVSLSDKSGIVLLGQAPPPPPPPPAIVVSPTPNPKPGQVKKPRPKGQARVQSLSQSRTRQRRLRRTVLVRGRLIRGEAGRLRLTLARRHMGHWHAVRARTIRVMPKLAFRLTFRHLARGRYRVTARYVGRGRAHKTRRFRLHY
jgi:hypothetical protein